MNPNITGFVLGVSILLGLLALLGVGIATVDYFVWGQVDIHI